MNLTIRNAALLDLDRLMEMELTCFPPAEAAPREVFAYRLKRFGDWCFAALLDGGIVGLIMGRPTLREDIYDELYEAAGESSGDCLAIICVETDPAFRGRGVARAMVGHMLAQAGARGVRAVTLACKDHLIAFYESLGFQRMGISASVHGGVVWNEMKRILYHANQPAGNTGFTSN